MDVDEEEWSEVETLLEAEMPHLENEVESLYNDVERYARRADVLDGAGQSDEATYFRELALEAYDSFVNVIQLKKSADDYDF